MAQNKSISVFLLLFLFCFQESHELIQGRRFLLRKNKDSETLDLQTPNKIYEKVTTKYGTGKLQYGTDDETTNEAIAKVSDPPPPAATEGHVLSHPPPLQPPVHEITDFRRPRGSGPSDGDGH